MDKEGEMEKESLLGVFCFFPRLPNRDKSRKRKKGIWKGRKL
jgi:hypothetical protein